MFSYLTTMIALTRCNLSIENNLKGKYPVNNALTMLTSRIFSSCAFPSQHTQLPSAAHEMYDGMLLIIMENDLLMKTLVCVRGHLEYFDRFYCDKHTGQ
jgi:hypothetical protein